MSDALDVVEDVFREKGLGKVQMPSKPYLFFESYEGDLRVMPAYIPDLDAAEVKIVNSHPKNPERYNLPSVLATLMLVDPKNGLPRSIMGANTLTSIRTGAAGALAAKHLARNNSEVLGLVGAGVQARTQLQGLMEVLPKISLVKVYDLDRTRSTDMSNAVSKMTDLTVEAVETPELSARGSDVIVSTTPSRKPVLRRDWIDPGTHINAIGADAPGKQELEFEILRDAKVVVDDWEQASHGGEVNVAVANEMLTRENIHAELGEVVCGKFPGRETDEEITVFDSTGLAIQDIAVASFVHRRAIESKRGRQIDLWG